MQVAAEAPGPAPRLRCGRGKVVGGGADAKFVSRCWRTLARFPAKTANASVHLSNRNTLVSLTGKRAHRSTGEEEAKQHYAHTSYEILISYSIRYFHYKALLMCVTQHMTLIIYITIYIYIIRCKKTDRQPRTTAWLRGRGSSRQGQGAAAGCGPEVLSLPPLRSNASEWCWFPCVCNFGFFCCFVVCLFLFFCMCGC